MNALKLTAAGVALLSWLGLCLATRSTPEGLGYYDPVVQLKALQQYQRGQSRAWNVWARVDPTDLSRDRAETIGWWPPAIPALIHPLEAGLGLNLGRSLRLLVLVAGAAGAAGWAVWWACFPLPAGWIFTLAALAPWLRYASSEFFRFSGEVFAFAAAPWIFLGLAAGLVRLRQCSSAGPALASIGFLLGASYWLKYSLFVTALAGLGATALLAWKAAGDWRRVARPLLVLTLAMTAAPLALKLFNAGHHGLDPMGRPNPANATVTSLLFFFANPALAVADAAGPFFQALVYPGLAGLGGHDQTVLAWIGLPGGVILARLLYRVLRQPPSDEAALAAAALPIFSLLMAGLWLTSDVARDSRLFIPAAFAALPAALLAGRADWAARPGWTRLVLGLSALLYVVAPLAYGPAYVALKIAGSRAIRPGPTGLNLPSLGAADQQALLAVLPQPDRSSTVWIVADLEASLELPGRALTAISGRSIAEDMRNIYRPPASLAQWRTSTPIELRALSRDAQNIPPLLATLGGTSRWIPHRLPVGGIVLWSAVMKPAKEAH